ncbi:hypothetical protein BKA67DRAFT_209384 [Truncatella angustata]|uniref:Rhodopsin domain-containing protein n=1 Tax=Truncatella angustata TaxID=152316 RepID=A0A9P8UU68_9PEZI|nr:uncharacterized protein BKA67DRAFT_209384 [Truncatella angustata]KAH6658246.1 hypothetical protein BKA67DRAFT_209384 [Truncatella angustata]
MRAPNLFLIISWISVSCRLYTRTCILRSPWWDDLFVLLYPLVTTTGSIAVCSSVNHGLGKHFLTLTSIELIEFLKCFFVANAAYTSATTFIKLTLLFQYMRILDRGTRTYMIWVIVAIFTALWGIAFSFLLAWVPRIPVSEFWTQSSDGFCYGFGAKTPHETARHL